MQWTFILFERACSCEMYQTVELNVIRKGRFVVDKGVWVWVNTSVVSRATINQFVQGVVHHSIFSLQVYYFSYSLRSFPFVIYIYPYLLYAYSHRLPCLHSTSRAYSHLLKRLSFVPGGRRSQVIQNPTTLPTIQQTLATVRLQQ